MYFLCLTMSVSRRRRSYQIHASVCKITRRGPNTVTRHPLEPQVDEEGEGRKRVNIICVELLPFGATTLLVAALLRMQIERKTSEV